MLRKEVISGLIFRANIARLYNDRHGALNPLGGAHNDDLRPIVGFHRAKKQRLAYIDVGDADTGGIFKGVFIVRPPCVKALQLDKFTLPRAGDAGARERLRAKFEKLSGRVAGGGSRCLRGCWRCLRGRLCSGGRCRVRQWLGGACWRRSRGCGKSWPTGSRSYCHGCATTMTTFVDRSGRSCGRVSPTWTRRTRVAR